MSDDRLPHEGSEATSLVESGPLTDAELHGVVAGSGGMEEFLSGIRTD